MSEPEIACQFFNRNGRLNKKRDNVHGIGGWAAGGKRLGEYIQVDLRMVKVITMVATQGRQDCCSQWVTKYSLSYSNNGVHWIQYQGDCIKVYTFVENPPQKKQKQKQHIGLLQLARK